MMISGTARRNSGLMLAIAAIAGAGGMASLAITRLAETRTGYLIGLGSTAGPLLVYLSIVAPLVFPFGLYVLSVPFDSITTLTSFGSLTRLLAMISGVAILLFVARTRRAVPPPRALLWWVAFYAWAAATAFWAIDDRPVFGALSTALQLLALYTAVAMIPIERNGLRFVCVTVVVGGVAAAAYAIYQLHSGNLAGVSANRLTITNFSVDPTANAIDPNHFAAALLLPIALCATQVLHQRRHVVMVANAACLGVLVLALALCQSRGAVLALCLLLLYFLPFVGRLARARLVVLMGASMFAAAVFGAQLGMWDRFADTFSTGGSGRTSIWQIGLVAFKSHWLLGAGFGNFAFAYDEALLKTAHANWYSNQIWDLSSHNVFLGMSVEVGLIGLALFLAAWGAQFVMLRCIDRQDPEYPLRVALEGAVLATFVSAFFLDIFFTKYFWLTFMLVTLVRGAHYTQHRLSARTYALGISRFAQTAADVGRNMFFVDYLRDEFLPAQEERTRRADKEKICWTTYRGRKGRIMRFLVDPLAADSPYLPKSNRLSLSTKKRIAYERIRSATLGTLTPAMLAQFCETLAACDDMKSSTRKALYQDLRLALRLAGTRLSSSIPQYFAKVETPALQPARQRDFWDPLELLRVLFDVAKPIEARALYAVQLLTLARPSEIFALTWADLDLDNATITFNKKIERTSDGWKVVSIGKAAASEGVDTIPLVPLLRDILRHLKKHALSRGELQDRVFLYDGRPLNSDRIDRAFKAAREALGLRPGPTFYTLKYVGNSVMDGLGVPASVRQFMARRTSPSIVQNAYLKLSGEVPSAVTKFDEALRTMLKAPSA
ncbi:MAG: O-antigen ligase family protein [Candidatus Eremiobacteraeota bacterium]|nr:O-antigen ligase family protein [Candidatus Eremiobacteraeota bacterium]